MKLPIMLGTEDGSIELFGFSVFVHSAQDVCHDICFPRDVVNGKVEFLKSVQPPDLAVGSIAMVWRYFGAELSV